MSTQLVTRAATVLAMALVLGAGFAPALDGAIIHVPQDQPTIQAGIDAAVDGDTVLVDDGTSVSQWIVLKAFPGYRYGSTVAAGEF
jgi:hypothetical protein